MFVGFIVLWILFKFPKYYREMTLIKLGMYWYPFILITPGLCLILAEIFSLFKKAKFTKNEVDSLICHFLKKEKRI